MDQCWTNPWGAPVPRCRHRNSGADSGRTGSVWAVGRRASLAIPRTAARDCSPPDKSLWINVGRILGARRSLGAVIAIPAQTLAGPDPFGLLEGVRLWRFL